MTDSKKMELKFVNEKYLTPINNYNTWSKFKDLLYLSHHQYNFCYR